MNILFRTILNMSLAGAVVIVAVMAARLLLLRQYVPYHYLITAFTRVPVGSVG